MPTMRVSSSSPADIDTDLLVVPALSGPTLVNGGGEVLGDDPSAALRDAGNDGELGDLTLVPTAGRGRARMMAFVGLGPRGAVSRGTSQASLMRAAMRVARTQVRFRSVALSLDGLEGPPADLAAAFVEGILLGAYRFERYRSEPSRASEIDEIIVLTTDDPAAVQEAMERASVYAEATAWARDLINTPASDLGPEEIAGAASGVADEFGMSVRILRLPELREGGFGGIVAVGGGSSREPGLIELTYRGAGDAPPIVLVGKGVAFDSGGLNLKINPGIGWMKADMGGAGAVLGAMRAIGTLNPPVNVTAVVATVENMPSGTSYRPGDILRQRNGRTTEVTNTDAEGRLILADALAYAAERGPSVIVDVATLTATFMGEDLWMVLGNDQSLVDELLSAGRLANDHGWQLPLWQPYRTVLKSTVADQKHFNPDTNEIDTLAAALFLETFVDGTPWAHLDIPGVAFRLHASDFWAEGATGSPVRALVRFIEERARS